MRFNVDRDDLETRYLDRSREVHPDRFAGASSGEQREAMESAAALNEAYRALRDPVRRAEYLVCLAGIDLDAQGSAPGMDQGFLMDMIDRRERLDAARGDEDALDTFFDEVEGEIQRIFGRAVERIASGDTPAAARELVARRYLQRLADEIETARDES